jgi:hypothetical protein
MTTPLPSPELRYEGYRRALTEHLDFARGEGWPQCAAIVEAALALHPKLGLRESTPRLAAALEKASARNRLYMTCWHNRLLNDLFFWARVSV